MKCYFCKKETTTAIRTFVPARNHREKSNFRDLCEDCYRELEALRAEISAREEANLALANYHAAQQPVQRTA